MKVDIYTHPEFEREFKRLCKKYHSLIDDYAQLLDDLELSAATLTYAVGILCSLPLYMDGLLKLFVFVALYVAWSVLFRPWAYQYFCMTAMPLIEKIKGKKNKSKK